MKPKTNQTGVLLLIAAAALTSVSCTSTGTRTSNPLAREAISWVGKSYAYGRKRQCANFVGHCMDEAGLRPPARRAVAQSYWKIGTKVHTPRPGDIVVFKNTYRGPNYITHVGIVVDNKTFVHRPTFRGKVQRATLASYRGKIVEYRRVAPMGVPYLNLPTLVSSSRDGRRPPKPLAIKPSLAAATVDDDDAILLEALALLVERDAWPTA